jgi:hypothetical protein
MFVGRVGLGMGKVGPRFFQTLLAGSQCRPAKKSWLMTGQRSPSHCCQHPIVCGRPRAALGGLTR